MSDEVRQARLYRPLQLAILGALWRDNRLTWQQLWRAVAREHKWVAPSTLSTTLTRLHEYHWIEREQKGVYRARITREEMIDTITHDIREA